MFLVTNENMGLCLFITPDSHMKNRWLTLSEPWHAQSSLLILFLRYVDQAIFSWDKLRVGYIWEHIIIRVHLKVIII